MSVFGAALRAVSTVRSNGSIEARCIWQLVSLDILRGSEQCICFARLQQLRVRSRLADRSRSLSEVCEDEDWRDSDELRLEERVDEELESVDVFDDLHSVETVLDGFVCSALQSFAELVRVLAAA